MSLSLYKLSQYCAHMQNSVRAKNPITALPYTEQNLAISYKLMMNGFISSIQRGSTNGPDVDEAVEVTEKNLKDKRLWLGLKYRNDKSAFVDMLPLSIPSLPLKLNLKQLRDLASNNLDKDPVFKNISAVKPGELVLVREILPLSKQEASKIYTLSQAAANEKYGAVMDLNEAVSKNISKCILLLRAY
ncbi:hypothetical protein ACO0OL_003675 [Hanseniaspora opuntiae]|jgi:ribosomal protein S8|uniref:37S ribosomal protein S8, mitochondrial n=1 Tax=Hanseniaspora opuntiae TaxID=211096 RepID=A0A1E5RMI2_9ASCO|nr:37S ribosomal protein S8, mitochondrial [Hanseniaspora opuntiae]